MRRSDLYLALGAGGVIAAAAAVSPVAGMGLLGVTVAAAAVGVYRQLRRHTDADYAQLEALASLVGALGPSLPLPPLRGWAVSPDFGALLVETVLARRPRRLLELGSGVSTLLMAYAVRKAGRGDVIAIEHDAAHRRRVLELLERHGLRDRVRIVEAALAPLSLHGERHVWYDEATVRDAARAGDPFDLLVVDGPPVPPASRYPAIPVLRGSLSPGAVALLDDADRREARSNLTRWSEEDRGLRIERRPTEKGAAILRWPGGTSDGAAAEAAMG